MARIILKAPRNTPAAALLGDLGWLDFQSMHSKVKTKFLFRLKNMDLNRWPKLCLNALFISSNNNNVRELNWKWLKSISTILNDHNMDMIFTPHCENMFWLSTFFY